MNKDEAKTTSRSMRLTLITVISAGCSLASTTQAAFFKPIFNNHLHSRQYTQQRHDDRDRRGAFQTISLPSSRAATGKLKLKLYVDDDSTPPSSSSVGSISSTSSSSGGSSISSSGEVSSAPSSPQPPNIPPVLGEAILNGDDVVDADLEDNNNIPATNGDASATTNGDVNGNSNELFFLEEGCDSDSQGKHEYECSYTFTPNEETMNNEYKNDYEEDEETEMQTNGEYKEEEEKLEYTNGSSSSTISLTNGEKSTDESKLETENSPSFEYTTTTTHDVAMSAAQAAKASFVIDQEEMREMSEKFAQTYVRPIFSREIEKGVPYDVIKGAAVSGAGLTILAGQGVLLAGAAGLGAAYVTITPGPTGGSLRTIGSVAWNSTQAALELSKKYELTKFLGTAVRVFFSGVRNLLRGRKLLDGVRDGNDMLFDDIGPSGNSGKESLEALQAQIVLEGDLKERISKSSVRLDSDVAKVVQEAESAVADVQNLVQKEKEAKMAKNAAVEEARLATKEEARLVAEEEAKMMAEREAILAAEEEARIVAEEEAKMAAEEEAKLAAEEEARIAAEEEAKLAAEEEARLAAEEEARIAAEEKAILAAEEEAKLAAEEEARLAAEEEAKLAEEEAKAAAAAVEEEMARAAKLEAERIAAEEEATRLAKEDDSDDEEYDDFFESVLKEEEARLTDKEADKSSSPDDGLIDEDDWEASILLAEMQNDETWDAAREMAKNLADEIPETEEKDPIVAIDGVADMNGMSLEELGKAARAAVEQYEKEQEEIEITAAAEKEKRNFMKIPDFQTDIEKMIDARDAVANYEKLTVVKLKDILRSRGLKVSGRKAELIQRLRDDDEA